jgi:hypothetical protein
MSDGLISRGKPLLSEDRKIVLFRPRYRIPRVSLGHFNHFEDYTSGDFCIAYAGNFSLIATIIKNFLDVVQNKLALDRAKNGTPVIFRHPDHHRRYREASYDDSYNFASGDLPPITVNLLANILEKVAQKACDDFIATAWEPASAEFLLFGEDRAGHSTVKRVQVLRWLPRLNEQFYERYSALPWTLVCIGDQNSIDTLAIEIEANPLYATRPQAVPTYDEELDWSDSGEQAAEALHCSNREMVIKRSVLSLIEQGTSTIGGDAVVAAASWASPLALSVVARGNLRQAIENLPV